MTLLLDTDVATRGQQTRWWRGVLMRPTAAICLGYLGVVILASAAASLLAPYNPLATDLGAVLSGPTVAHPLGTDSLGRDVLSRMMFGGQTSLTGVAEAVLTVLVIGVPLGVAAGFFNGWFDRIVTWLIDLALAVPIIVILLVVLGVFANNHTAAMVALGLLGAPGLARVVRSATLTVRHELFITAARVAGLSSGQIMRKHVLPRISGPVIVQASLFAGVALLTETGLGFLGLGAQPPAPTWGGLVADASNVIDRQPWMLVPTGVVIGLAILSFGLIGDAVRDATTQRTGRNQRGSHARRRRRRPAPGDIRARPDGQPPLCVRGLSLMLPTAMGPVAFVDSIDLDIRPAEIVALVGESGCGKTLTGRAILGLLPDGVDISAGQVWLKGRELTALEERTLRRVRGTEIAFISQDPMTSLDPATRIGDQLREIVRRHDGGTRRDATVRAVELLESVRLPDAVALLKQYPHELSGGMAQRVAIAIALAGRPRLLIADEPTTALDVTVQAEILELLRGLGTDDGLAILLITHDWGVVATTCERAYVMYAGHIMESGPVRDLIKHPFHPYTANLLNSAPQRARRREHLPVIPGTVPQPGSSPGGCPFHPRCALATARCESGNVAISEPAEGHLVRCVHHTLLTQDGEHDRTQALT